MPWIHLTIFGNVKFIMHTLRCRSKIKPISEKNLHNPSCLRNVFGNFLSPENKNQLSMSKTNKICVFSITRAIITKYELIHKIFLMKRKIRKEFFLLKFKCPSIIEHNLANSRLDCSVIARSTWKVSKYLRIPRWKITHDLVTVKIEM
jgi:hypothetical protein